MKIIITTESVKLGTTTAIQISKKAGETVDIPDDDAKQLIRWNMAKPAPIT